MPRYLSGCILGAVLIVITVWVWRHREHPPAQMLLPLAPQNLPKDLGLEIEGVDCLIVRSPDGKKQWELTAEKIQISKSESVVAITGLSRAVCFRGDKPALTLTARCLRLNSISRDIEISGDVSVHTTQGLILHTPLVRWVASRREIVCPQGVAARMQGVALSTRRVVLFPHTNKLVCPTAVRVLFGAGGFMRADRLLADLSGGIIELNGNVFCRAQVGLRKVPFTL